MMHNELMKIIQYSIDNPYKYGDNDCNLIVLRIIDLFTGSTLANRNYTSVKEGIAGLKKEGWDHTGQIGLC